MNRFFLASSVILATLIANTQSCSEQASGYSAGDIAKVAKFKKNVVNDEMNAFQEKILNNPEEMDKAAASVVVLNARMVEFNELVKISAKAADGNNDLAYALSLLKRTSTLSENVRKSGNDAIEALKALKEGKQADYSQASQNLALAFLMVDRQISVGKIFVDDVDKFLAGKNASDYAELALTRDCWARYCAGHSAITGNDKALAYWKDKSDLCTGDVLSSINQQMTSYKEMMVQSQHEMVQGQYKELVNGQAAIMENSGVAHIKNVSAELGNSMEPLMKLAEMNSFNINIAAAICPAIVYNAGYKLGTSIAELGAREANLKSTASQLGAYDEALRSTASELGSREVDLRSTAKELGSREVDLKSTAKELGSREIELKSTISQIGAREVELGGVFRYLNASQLFSNSEQFARAIGTVVENRSAELGAAHIIKNMGLEMASTDLQALFAM